MEKKIYVKNLNFRTTEEELQAECSQFGTVTDVRIIKNTDEATGERRSRGFGFVTFENTSEAESAIRGLHQAQLDGRTLHVEEAIDKRNMSRPMNS
jgi:cold-inducible RNA-binding protein